MMQSPSHTYRLMAAVTAFFFISGSTLPLFASDSRPQAENQDLSVPAQKKKGAGAAASTPVPAKHSGKTAKSGGAPSHKKKPKKNPAAAESAFSDDYPTLRIGPGDVLNIQVYGESGFVGSGGGTSGVVSQLPTEYQVDSEGLIVFPFLGRVKLTGLTPAEASEKIARLLSKPRKVTVLIKDSNTYYVSVMGNVPKPGKYQILGKPTLLSALSLAGGPLPDTDMGGTILIHDKVKQRLNLDRYLRDTSVQLKDPYLYPGDVLMVQRSAWPTIGEWAIVASILASLAVVTVDLSNLKK
ncbi:MAG TPA: polysaccharide biosynthesis/export family protein [bacterium]|nr:polysaccharide biosynthesis/export family protein [bacterium]